MLVIPHRSYRAKYLRLELLKAVQMLNRNEEPYCTFLESTQNIITSGTNKHAGNDRNLIISDKLLYHKRYETKIGNWHVS